MSKLDSSFPSPGKMKLDMDQVSFVDKFSVTNSQQYFLWNTDDSFALVPVENLSKEFPPFSRYSKILLENRAIVIVSRNILWKNLPLVQWGEWGGGRWRLGVC